MRRRPFPSICPADKRHKRDRTTRFWLFSTVSRDTRNYSFQTPKVREALTVQITFDNAGNVATIRKWGADQVAKVDPAKRTTPTLGRKRGFFQDLFGNIGTVGAAGAGAGPGR